MPLPDWLLGIPKYLVDEAPEGLRTIVDVARQLREEEAEEIVDLAGAINDWVATRLGHAWAVVYGDLSDALDGVDNGTLACTRGLRAAMAEFMADPPDPADPARCRRALGKLAAEVGRLDTAGPMTEQADAEEPDADADADETTDDTHSKLNSSDPEGPGEDDSCGPSTPAPTPVFLPGPRQTEVDAAVGRIGQVFEHFSAASGSSHRIGLDFGTSQSKLIARSAETEAVDADRLPIGGHLTSALSINRATGTIAFGDAAVRARQDDFENTFLQRSLKRVILDGRSIGVAGIDPCLTTNHLVAFVLGWLTREAREQLVGAGDVTLAWCDLHVTTPVTGPHKKLSTYWRPLLARSKVGYVEYLRNATVLGAVAREAFGSVAPTHWRAWWEVLERVCQRSERSQAVLRARSVGATSEPLAALANLSNSQLESGLHLVVDSGAGTTDWVVVVVLDDYRRVAAERSMNFAGDDVDDAIMSLLSAEYGDGLIKRHEVEARLRILDDKPLLFEDGYMEYDPNLLPGEHGHVPFDVRQEDVNEGIKDRLRMLTEAIRDSLTDAKDRVANAEWNLARLGAPRKWRPRLKAVHFLGGNLNVPAFRAAVKRGVGGGVPVTEIATPISEIDAGRVDPLPFRVSAVAMGASLKELPRPGILEADKTMPDDISPYDKDSV